MQRISSVTFGHRRVMALGANRLGCVHFTSDLQAGSPKSDLKPVSPWRLWLSPTRDMDLKRPLLSSTPTWESTLIRQLRWLISYLLERIPDSFKSHRICWFYFVAQVPR